MAHGRHHPARARDNPQFYIRYVDVDGGRKTRRVRVATREDARKLLIQAEARVAQGRVGLEPVVALPRCGPLMAEWVSMLANRNAQDDRTRYPRHIRAAFEGMLVRDAQEIGPVMVWIDRQRKAGELSEASIRLLTRRPRVGDAHGLAHRANEGLVGAGPARCADGSPWPSRRPSWVAVDVWR
jgi:hypothetical protein